MDAKAGVKGLVDSGISTVPPEYVRRCQKEEQFSINDEEQLPIVNLMDFSDKESREIAMETIRRACKEWGFFQLTGHGIPEQVMDEMKTLVLMFFDLPANERMLYYSDDTHREFQFSSSFNPHIEKTRQWHDSLFQYCCPPAATEMLPEKSIPNYSKISSDYSKYMHLLARRLLEIFSDCLGLEPDTLTNAGFMIPRHTMRMNYYPPSPNPDLVVGLDRHTDPGGFTILQQDARVQGLQILQNGKWINVKPVEHALVINIADQLQILTNGLFRSVEHRALTNSTTTRVSIATFYCPDTNAYIAPLPQLGPPKFKGCKYEIYLQAFLSSPLYSSKSTIEPSRDY